MNRSLPAPPPASGPPAPGPARPAAVPPAALHSRTVHPIEEESFRILRSRLDTSRMPPLTRAVVERVVHSSADPGYAADLVCDEPSLAAAREALAAGAPIVADVEMVASGITARKALCRLRDAVPAPGLTRSAHAIRLAYTEVGPGAVWVIGCAPTALEELLTLDAAPALIIGLPVGFVGAAESKAALRASGLPAVSNISEKGGSAVAAAALNALLYTAPVPPTAEAPHPYGTGVAGLAAGTTEENTQ